MVFSAHRHASHHAEQPSDATIFAWGAQTDAPAPAAAAGSPAPPSTSGQEVYEAQDNRASAAPQAGQEEQLEADIDRLMRTPDASPARHRPGFFNSPVSGLMAQAPGFRPQPHRGPDAAPPPLRAPWHDVHQTLAEEVGRAGRLADENARLRLHNSELLALVQSQRARLNDLESIEDAYSSMRQVAGQQRRQLRQLQITAAQTQTQLATLLQQAMGPASAGDSADANAADAGADVDAEQDDLTCDEQLGSEPPRHPS